MAAIGIRIDIQQETWAQFLAKAHQGSLQVFQLGWIIDYPDPQDFLQLFYGPYKAPGPNACNYENPEYDKLYDQMASMENTPERLAIVRKMVDIVVNDAVWIPAVNQVTYTLRQPWLKNSKPNDMTGGFTKYRDVDVPLRTRLRKEWNPPNYAALAVIVALMLGTPVALTLVRRGPRGGE